MKSFFKLDRFDDAVPFLLESFELRHSERAVLGPDALSTTLTIESLRAGWLHPAEITEFAEIATRLPLDGVRVIRAPGFVGECGYSYLPDEYRVLQGIHLIALDDLLLPENLSLKEVFLHEVAHSRSRSAPHDWQFVVYLNLLRLEVGLGPTMDEYDCQDDASIYAVSSSEILHQAAQTAVELRARFDLKMAASLVSVPPYESARS